MGRPSNTEERRTQIVEGLLHAMAEHGYDRASVHAIADKAGLAPGLVHYHFKNKQEILLSLITHLGVLLSERYERRAKAAGSPRARLYAFLDAHVALGSDAHPAAVACWVGIGAVAVRDPEVRIAFRDAMKRNVEQVEVHVRAVLDDEGRATSAVKDIAAGLVATIHGCYQLSTVPNAAPRGFAAPTVRRIADGLIAAQPEAT